MRLTSIKLAGFKSFVDPTHFQVPGQRVGVVGPNGCGKSNIIDAVRWVLGESRASELRGESMQDVIFNGSTNRKPGSRASVELVFDNGDARAAGQWSQYAEIAVKRVLTRDGTSSYYINNLPARRRDIQDIFLGTGLGPRAYAIIGQGMIARIIEARPEDLRIFLEEAAGVSKYKERRRETASRLADTRDNLVRVEDIRRELGGNLEKLEAQAAVAQRYRALQAEGEEKQHLLWLLRRNEADAEQQRHARGTAAAQLELDARTTRLREIEAELEALRVAHYAGSDAAQRAQGALYEAAAEVSRLEAEIRFVVEARQRSQAQLEALEAQQRQWLEQAAAARAGLADAHETLAIAEQRHAFAQAEAGQAAEQIPPTEAAWRAAQQALGDMRAGIAHTEQSLRLAAAARQNATRQIEQVSAREMRLRGELHALDAPDDAMLEDARTALAEAEAVRDDAQARVETLGAVLPALDDARRAALADAQAQEAARARSDARLAALRALQESLQAEGKLQSWLERHELATLPRLWRRISVEAGWESAIEAVLRERLSAIEVSRLDLIAGLAVDAPPAGLAFFPAPAPLPDAASGQASDGPGALEPLLSRVRIDDPQLRAVLGDWLAGAWTATDLDEALARRDRLADGQCLVVKAGHLVSRAGLAMYAPDHAQAGMLAREREIAKLEHETRAQALFAEEAAAAAGRAESAHAHGAAALGEARAQATRATQHAHALQMDALRLAQTVERFEARSVQLSGELDETAAQLDELRATAATAQDDFEQADAQLAERQSAFEDQKAAFEALDARLADARLAQREREQRAAEAQFEARSAGGRIAELSRTLEAAVAQAARIAASLDEARAQLGALDDEAARAALVDALERRAAREDALAASRAELDTLTAQLRAADETRLSTERSLQPLRDRVTESQLKEQAARLSFEQYAEQLAAVLADEAELAGLAARLTPDLRPSWLQGEVTRLNQAISALGPVNMAALEELNAARERKAFLDAQSADLGVAMETLEDAIRKIDQETRALLQGTFDEVNRHFGELFPRLFGGGQASLVMTGDEILDAGVQVMAQPPGKKNSTIHLLSGGEKALTATALVFAMFQLNPAPFCLLDEVDAPLDDANTERFANLVRAMSDKTQFLFISHNKIAMEMAQQLIGVTMQEQGVSRIVAVDMETAASFAHNAG
jgi:chromosome segregation protein